MKTRNLFIILFFIIFTVSCTIYGVKYDYDRQANFEELKTFDWMQVPENTDINSFHKEGKKYSGVKALCSRLEIMSQENEEVDFSSLRIYKNLTKEDYSKILSAYFNGFVKAQ